MRRKRRYSRPLTKYNLGGNYGSDSETTDSMSAAAGTTVSAINPAIGAIYQVGSGIGKNFRTGNEDKASAQVASDIFNPSHALFSAIEEGKPLESIPIYGAFQRAKRAEREKEEALIQQTKKSILENDRKAESVFATFPIKGEERSTYKHGGKLKNDNPEVIDNSKKIILSKNSSLYKGDTHENSGIDIDTDGDKIADAEIENDEVIIDNKVLSNRLNPSKRFKQYAKESNINIKDNDTYANVAEQIERKKGKLQKPKFKADPIGNKTSELMVNKYNKVGDTLFEDQEITKEMKTRKRYYADGGKFPPNKDFIEGLPIEMQQKIYNDLLTLKNPLTGEEENYETYRKSLLSNPDKINNYLRTQRYDGDINSYIKDRFSKAKARFLKEGEIPEDYRNSILESTIDRAKKIDRTTTANKEAIKNLNEGNETQIKVEDINNKINQLVQNTSKKKFGEGGFMNFMSDNSGQFANAGNFLSNNAIINKMETEINPELIDSPRYRYKDRSHIGFGKNSEGFATSMKSLETSGLKTGANTSSLLANKLKADNAVASNENIRKDNYDQTFDESVRRTSSINSQIKNRANESNMTRRNDKLALKQQNNQAFMQGIVGNQEQNEAQQMERDAMFLTAIKDGDRGIVDRLLKDYPELAKRFRLQLKEKNMLNESNLDDEKIFGQKVGSFKKSYGSFTNSITG